MKPFPIAAVFAVIGAVIGVVLGMRDVGTVELRLHPPAGDQIVSSDPAENSKKSSSAPRVEIDQEVYDFGQMQRGTSESHEFRFVNAGGTPLRLEVLKTTCKCTIGESPGAILPGDSAPVRLEWTAKTQAGPFRQEATIRTNDPRRPSLKLTVEGEVVEAVALSPGEFSLGRVESGSPTRSSLLVLAFDQRDEPLEVTARLSETSRNPESYRLSVEPIDPAEAGHEEALEAVRVNVEAAAGLPIGSLIEWVVIETNLPDLKSKEEKTLTFQAPVIGTVVGDISVHGAKFSTPRSLLNLGKIESAAGREAKLFLSFKGKHAADLRGELIEADPEWIEVDFEAPKRVRDEVFRQFFTVRIPPGRPAEVRSGGGIEAGGVGDGDAVIRLSTGHPTTPELDVKVRFVIAE